VWLKFEWRYVGTAVPKGDVGDLPGVVEQLDVVAAAPKALSVECIETMCCLGDEVVSLLVSRGSALLVDWLLHLRWSVLCLLLS
jgi:hypothetical protein